MKILEQYKQFYGKYPERTIEAQRHFKQFQEMLEKYGIESLLRFTQSPVTNVAQKTGHCTYHYQINDLTSDLLVSHIKLIHEKWNIPLPVVKWWSDAIRKQAVEMMNDYSQIILHYYMHRLENDSWYRKNIVDAFTFKMVRKYIERSLIDKEIHY